MRAGTRPLKRALVGAVCALVAAGSPAPAQAEWYQPDTLIIPMDTDYQDWGMFRAYGLVYALLQAGIPVDWVIDPEKTAQVVDEPVTNTLIVTHDFSVQATDLESEAALPAVHDYRGGPFVIPAVWFDEASAVIEAFWTAHPITDDPLRNVTVHRASVAFEASVSRRLVVAPSIAMFADGKQDIARKYMDAARIPDSSRPSNPSWDTRYEWPDESPDMLTVAEVSGPTETNHSDGALFDADGDPRYCQLMSMHWGVGESESDPEVVAEVRAYLGHPVHFFAECQAVNAFENSPHGHFLTKNGFKVDNPNDSVEIAYNHPEQPFAQLDGAYSLVGGSEKGYTPCSVDPGSVKVKDCETDDDPVAYYKTDRIVMITARDSGVGTQDIWMTGFLDGACPPEAHQCLAGSSTGGVGKVSYLGGHEYSQEPPISEDPTTLGTRLFLQSLFEAPCATDDGQPTVTATLSAPAGTTSPEVTWTISILNEGPGIARDAVLTVVLPAGAAFDSATGGGTEADGVVTWALGTFGVFEGASVTFSTTFGGFGSYATHATLDYRVGATPAGVDSAEATVTYDADTDEDGVVDGIDSCPGVYNPLQDLNSDPDSCGMCGVSCARTNATVACSAGSCVMTGCEAGFFDCNGGTGDGCEVAAADFDDDAAHCGGCNVVCTAAHATSVCGGGSCAIGECDAGYSDCNGLPGDGCEITDAAFASSLAHCGACNARCKPANAFGACDGGECGIAECHPGAADCNGLADDGCELDAAGFQTSTAHCGGCDQACAPPSATGACVGGGCTVGSCDAGSSDCNGSAGDGCEYDDAGFASDLANCGGCAQVCAPANAAAACTEGVCGVDSCADGWANCNGDAGDGCEIATERFAYDDAHCGGCGQACALPGAVDACVGGGCVVLSCQDGMADCNGIDSDGCEYVAAGFDDDEANCGGCGQACAPAGGVGVCSAGDCAIASCDAGASDCDGVVENGCEYADADFASDLANCGGCGQACVIANGDAACEGGVCGVASCSGVFRDCNGDAADGCEYASTGFADDPAHCGGCNQACATPNATAACGGGECAVAACDDGFSDCNGDASDGCEAADATFAEDPANCGGCGQACAFAAAGATCAGGMCVMGACDDGSFDCNGDPTDGCERSAASLDADPLHCGACGVACDGANALNSCVGGACVIDECASGYADCNESASDGCETSPGQQAVDPGNCGGCGLACTTTHGTPACQAGVCVVGDCDAGWLDCDGESTTGCEYPATALADDVENCGACGRACDFPGATETCSDGVCAIAGCDGGLADCNGSLIDGCEYGVAGFADDEANCGGCGVVCDPAHASGVCATGSCAILACDPGWEDCNGDAADGCEVASAQLATDPANCGACGVACVSPNAAGACQGGECALGACEEGRADCNADDADGCEVAQADFDSSLVHCGGCGLTCAAANGEAACTGGSCAITACDGDWADCNGRLEDGCEVATARFADDMEHCGGCGVVCDAAQGEATCDAGVCALTGCDDGWVDADGDVANGCEYACVATAALDATCDGVDDDCDGELDEDFEAGAVTCGVGVCAASGERTCVDGVADNTCTPGAPSDETRAATTCDDDVDNDCDGLVDGDDVDCEACSDDTHCDDGDACTVDRCDTAGRCTYLTLPSCGEGGDDAGPTPVDEAPPADTGSGADAGNPGAADTGTQTQTQSDSAESGCGCRVDGQDEAAGLTLWAAALLSWLLVRRRRRAELGRG